MTSSPNDPHREYSGSSQASEYPPETAEFLRLYNASQSYLFSYIFTLLPNWNEAEEVLHETSIVLWHNFGKFQPGTNFKAWARQTALYQVLSFRKRRLQSPLPMSEKSVEVLAEETADLDDTLEQQLQAMAWCVEKLKPYDKDILNRFYGLSIPVKVLAEQLGRPVGTITKSLTRIRRTLFKCINLSLAVEDTP